MTYQDRMKFEPILNSVLETLKESRVNSLIFDINNTQLAELLKTAKRKNKLNNYMLKEDTKEYDAVFVYECLDTNTNNLVKIVIYPNDKNTVKQLFVYEVLNSQYATKQEYTQFKNIHLYIDYVNNFISVERFANHYNIGINEANLIVNKGRELNNKLAENK